ncbi:MAG: hypothetical protein QHH07_05730 [Sedimentisphaerales bacterium]|jgi:hypothetical protein|nr:hypothetical protein [Sedimentisphaerales bacterium]
MSGLRLLLLVMVIGTVLSLLGCSESDPGRTVIQAIPLGASNGYVLIQHPNGKLYTIRLEDGEALTVWNMPDIGKR